MDIKKSVRVTLLEKACLSLVFHITPFVSWFEAGLLLTFDTADSDEWIARNIGAGRIGFEVVEQCLG